MPCALAFELNHLSLARVMLGKGSGTPRHAQPELPERDSKALPIAGGDVDDALPNLADGNLVEKHIDASHARPRSPASVIVRLRNDSCRNKMTARAA